MLLCTPDSPRYSQIDSLSSPGYFHRESFSFPLRHFGQCQIVRFTKWKLAMILDWPAYFIPNVFFHIFSRKCHKRYSDNLSGKLSHTDQDEHRHVTECHKPSGNYYHIILSLTCNPRQVAQLTPHLTSFTQTFPHHPKHGTFTNMYSEEPASFNTVLRSNLIPYLNSFTKTFR